MDAADLYRGHLIERKRLIIGETARGKRYPGLVLIAIDHFASLHDAIQLAAAAIERRDERPPEILMWVADMGQLPVKNGGNAAGLLEKVSNAVVAVNDRHSWWRWAVLMKPQAGPIEQRVIANEGPGHERAPRRERRTFCSLAGGNFGQQFAQRQMLPVDG